MFTAIRKAVGSRESTRMMRGISLTTSHEDSMGWTRSSLSGPLQRSTNSSSSCTRITAPLYPRSSASRQRIIRPGERSSPTQEAISKRATEWAVLAQSVDIRLSGPPVRAGRPPRGGARIAKWITRTVSRRHGPAKLTPRSHQARNARLFPDLPAFTADEAFLYALGRAGGLCDCGDAEDDEASLGTEAAGWPFFGQFVAHDITADRSALQSHVDPTRLRNARSPQLNLECLYGDGPVGHPYLFQRNDPAKLLLGADGQDVLRNGEGTAIIGDPRNDSHVLMSQMHLAFVRAHNQFVDSVRSGGTPESNVFESAARELRWHYQTVVVREFLPTLVGAELVRSLLDNGPSFYRPAHEPFIPLEFADAAYRYGHSQIRHSYALNSASA